MQKMFKDLIGSKNGATAIEYGLIAGLVAVAIVTIVTATGGDLVALFTTVNAKLVAAAG